MFTYKLFKSVLKWPKIIFYSFIYILQNLKKIYLTKKNHLLNTNLLFSQTGFSLTELLITTTIGGVALIGIVTLLSQIADTTFTLNSKKSIVSFKNDVRTALSTIYSDGTPQCMNNLGFVYYPNFVSSLSNLLSQPNGELLLPTFNPITGGTNELTYGDATIKSESLKNIRITRSYNGYYQQNDAVIDNTLNSLNPLGPPVPLAFLVTADLETSLEFNKNAKVQKSMIRISFAIMRLLGGSTATSSLQVVDCGIGSLSRTLSVFSACKALGNDFVYVIDNNTQNKLFIFNSATNNTPINIQTITGQCYAPYYDTPGGNPVGYMPLEAFFCYPSSQLKSFNSPLCMVH